MSPLLTSSTPAENQGRLAANRDIVLTFNVAMLAGAGTITLSDGASQTYINKQGASVTRFVNATDTRTISILDSSQVSIDGNTVTLHLNTPLKSGLSYSVQVGSGALLDTSGAAFTGLRDATGLRFTTLPAAAPLALVGAEFHLIDSGSSAGDFITNVAAQSVSGSYSGKLASGEFVEVSLDDGLHWSRATAGAGAWSVNGTINASNTVLARVSNSDGLSSATAAQSYVFDTVAPQLYSIDLGSSTLAPGATALLTVAFSERVANLNTDAFTVSGGALSGLVSLDGGYTWRATLTAPTNQNGNGSIALNLGSVADLAGNAGSGLVNGPGYTYGVVTPALAQVSGAIRFTDSGGSASDYITNVVAQSIHGTYSGSLAGDDSIEVSIDNGASWHDASVDTANSVWSYATDLAASNTMQARVHRAGGTLGDTVSQAYVLDTSAPTVSVNLALDHGYLTTSQTATVSITFSEKMTQLGAGTVTASAGTLSAFTSNDGGTTWSATLTPPAGQMGEGGLTLHHNLFYDLAGNAGSDTVSGANYSYNTVPVSTDVPTPLLAAGSDRGLHDDDHKTSGAVTITGSAAVGTTVKLYDNGSTTELGAGATANSDGIWTIEVPGLIDGDHALRVTLTPPSGSTGALSDPLNLVINNTLPLATLNAGSIDMDDLYDSFITRMAGQSIQGYYTGELEQGEQIEVSTDNGLTWGIADTYEGYFSESTRVLTQSDTIVVRISNDYGSGTALTHSYTYDPSIPTVLQVDAARHAIDGEHPNGAYLPGDTIVITVTFSEAVTVSGVLTLDLGTYYAATYVAGSGTDTLVFHYEIGSGMGTDNLQYASTDALSGAAGAITNLAGDKPVDLTLPELGPFGLGSSDEQPVVVDAPRPDDLSALLIADGYDSGRSASDGVTDSIFVSFTGALVGAGDEVVLYDGNEVVGRTIAGIDGNWSILNDENKPFSEGAHHISVMVAPYHNEGRPGPALDLTIDLHTATANLYNKTLMLGDAAYSGTALPTNDSTPTITITGMRSVTGLSVNDTIDLGDGSGSYYKYASYTVQAADIDGNGTWIGADNFDITVANALSENSTSTVLVSIGELASDYRSTTSTIKIKVDTTAPSFEPSANPLNYSGPIHDIELNFSENIQFNTGAEITIYDGAHNVVAHLDLDPDTEPGQPAPSISDNILTLPSDALAGLSSEGYYSLEITAGSLSDLAGNVYLVGTPDLMILRENGSP